MKEYVDRGGALEGQDRTLRDIKVPYTSPRLLDNFALPDRRARRRLGFGSVHEPVRTQALCKHTGVNYSKRLIESDHNKGTVASTPLSYGLIHWNTDFQLRRAEPKTIEFMVRLGDKEELIKNGFARIADYPGGAAWNNLLLRPVSGVYLLDQTLLSNHHIFNDSIVSAPGANYDLGAAYLTATQFDVFPLTTMAFGYNEVELWFTYGLVEKSGGGIGKYWNGLDQRVSYSFPGGAYTVGDIYHVAIVYDPALGANGRFTLYINGVSILTKDIPAGAQFAFPGEYDLINGVTYAAGQKRDIVILNECTARGSYSSACKIRGDMHGHQTFFHDFSNAPNTGINPWCCSPPRGTAMWDLRIWNEARVVGDVLANKFKRITDDITNLVGNWHLNDGISVCTNKVTGRERQYCTVHHGYPSYVKEPTMLNGHGLKLGEGQHIIKSVGKEDKDFGSGFAAQLGNVFTDNLVDIVLAPHLTHRDQHSFSVMIQIMVPDAFQPELNDKAADPLTMKDLTLVETRRYMNTGATQDYDVLMDGGTETAAIGRQFIGHATDPAAIYKDQQHLRAYDQTLWSIEGTQRKDDVTVITNEANRRRIPIARGVITPAGKVAFELFKAQLRAVPPPTADPPKYFRLLSAASLVVGSVYTITFVQRVNYVYNAGTNKLDADGWMMELWIQNITAGTPVALSSSYTVAAASRLSTSSLAHDPNYDISIGASYVNDGWDHGINMPFPAGAVAMNRTSYVPPPAAGAIRTNHGPWPVQQRFMSPYQDQPGNFIIGMFRLWSLSLPTGLISDYGNSTIVAKDQTVDLLVNLEFKEIAGVNIPNKSRYPDPFRLGYKGWGMPQGYRNFTYQTIIDAYLKKELFEGTWSYEDCLGYIPINIETYQCNQIYTRVNGIAPFKASFGQQYGVVAVYDDSIAYDETVVGTYLPLFVSNHGMMAEFTPGLDWRGTVVGNRTILTSSNSLPKVFNGKTLTVAGLKRWSGGTPVVYESSLLAGGGLVIGKWYGVALAYFSEEYGLQHVSPVATAKTKDGQALAVFMIPHHPDQRISLIEVYRTIGQSTESLALSAPLYKTRIKVTTQGVGGAIISIAGGNTFAESITIDEADSLLTPVILDRNVTEFPMCAYSAELNGRLYLAGDVLNPDVIYFTDPGNPERIDSFASNVVLPKSSGDAVTGLISEFGSIFVFKPNAIWRIDDLGNNRHQLTNVASVGAVSDKSIQVIINPDTGKVFIFFWSQFGPYMFDGTNTQYIGPPIEETTFPGATAPQYNWLNPSSVVVGHNIEAREIICFYTPKRTDSLGVTTQLDRNGEAIVFNYRYRSWYRYTGTICTNALSFNFSGSLATRDTSSNTFRSNTYRMLLGGGNGKLYAWGTALTDGVPTGLSLTQGYVVTVPVSQDRYKIPTMPFTHELVGCWLTVVSHITGEWFTAPITKTDSANQNVTVNIGWVPFAWNGDGSTLGDTVYICQPPSLVEYPWDDLGVPFIDKDVVELITWHDTQFRYRVRFNYLPLVSRGWTRISDGNSQRKRTQIKKNVEAIKLELASFELGSSIDAYAYEVSPKRGANTSQA